MADARDFVLEIAAAAVVCGLVFLLSAAFRVAPLPSLIAVLSVVLVGTYILHRMLRRRLDLSRRRSAVVVSAVFGAALALVLGYWVLYCDC